jgi:tungstate transport system substrate-binding protein
VQSFVRTLRLPLYATLAVVLSACGSRPPAVTLATTTSMANSGLLDLLAPAYPAAIRILPAGSGRSLAMLEGGQADVVISHAPEHEAAALQKHPTWIRRAILYNRFVIVGPADDPAGVAGSKDAAKAMKRILESGARFLSRGDQSGTHERERQLWTAAGNDDLRR